MDKGQVPDFDLYEELEVAPRATRETIDAAYRSLAKRNHPDTARASDARIKRLNVAHEWLTDETLRRRYDATRVSVPAGRASSPGSTSPRGTQRARPPTAPAGTDRRRSPRTEGSAAGDQPPARPPRTTPVRPSPSSVSSVSWIRGHERTLLIVGVALALIVGVDRLLILSPGAATPSVQPTAVALGATPSATLRLIPSPTSLATTPTPPPKPTTKPTPTSVTGIGTPFTITEFDSDPKGTVTVTRLETWGGTSTIKPICTGCGFVTLYVKVAVSSNLGPYGGTWCWPSSYNTLWAVGHDGGQETFVNPFGRKPDLGTDILDCWAEGSRHEGWVTIDTGRDFTLDHVELEVTSSGSVARVYPTR